MKLTPAYDICPQLRSGFEATQAMQIEGKANNFSTISNVVSVCEHFLIESQQAKDLANFMVDTINSNWKDICGSAELTKKESELLYGKSVLNAFVFQDF